MSGVSNLETLLKSMEPELNQEKYFIASISETQLISLSDYLQHILCIFREKEGLTVVFSEPLKPIVEKMADGNISDPFAFISLKVHSDLMAVGLLAAITKVLAVKGISVNAFSAYFHDHLLVPYERRQDAMDALKMLSKSV